MEALLNTLSAFEKDFNLVQKDGSICFDATIYFSTKNNPHHHTEVQNVSIVENTLGTICLLHPNLVLFGIPDVLTEGKEEFIYLANQALVIMGESPNHEKYILSVHPGNKRCQSETITKLHARLYH